MENDFFKVKEISKKQCNTCLFRNGYICEKGLELYKNICKEHLYFKDLSEEENND